MDRENASSLKRPIHPMPDFVKKALEERKLIAAYRSRPPYQQNDYIGWISRARLARTQQKRLSVMLDELSAGCGYMGLKWGKPPR